MPHHSLRTITGCLRPTPTVYLPILAGIAPAHIRRDFHTYCLVQRESSNTTHLLYNHTSTPTTPHRHLASHRPFHQEALHLRNTSYNINNMWTNEWCKTGPHLPQFGVIPSTSPPAGFELPKKA